MDDQNSIIKLLVDGISARLDVLSGQLKVYQPILDRVCTHSDNTITELNNIKNDIKNIAKLLDSTATDFYERTDVLLHNIEEIKKICSDNQKYIESNSTNITSLKVTLCDKDGIKEKIDLMHENIKPISRFMTFISKPFGFLIFIIGLILASITITNVTNNIINYYNNNNKSETPQQK